MTQEAGKGSMAASSVEEEQLKFIAQLQAARSDALEKLIELSQTAKSDSAKNKALEILMRYVANYDPWKMV
jgi:hypothetical protein